MYQFPSDWVTRRVTHAVDRSYTPEGSLRTLKAFATTPPLFEEQRKILCPTLIMHGGEDPVFSKAHAEANLEKIPNSELWFDPKMGHIMHEEQWEEMAQKVKKLSLAI
ncbi:alpha/beta fold hydrolase [Vreelandella aquamarina]